MLHSKAIGLLAALIFCLGTLTSLHAQVQQEVFSSYELNGVTYDPGDTITVLNIAGQFINYSSTTEHRVVISWPNHPQVTLWSQVVQFGTGTDFANLSHSISAPNAPSVIAEVIFVRVENPGEELETWVLIDDFPAHFVRR